MRVKPGRHWLDDRHFRVSDSQFSIPKPDTRDAGHAEAAALTEAPCTRCLIPECGGIIQADPAFREALWARYFTAAPQPRTPSELRYSDRKLRSKTWLRDTRPNKKTVAKWRKRAFIDDAPMGPKTSRSTVLSSDQEAIIVAFRRHTLLPLDDCLYALQAIIPHLPRSSLHRCLKRHGISRLPEVAGDKTAKKPFKRYPIGCFHIDIAEVRTGDGKLYLFVAVIEPRSSSSRHCTRSPASRLRPASWRP